MKLWLWLAQKIKEQKNKLNFYKKKQTKMPLYKAYTVGSFDK